MFSGTPMPALYSVPEPQPSAICIVRPKTKAPTSRLTLGGPSAACSSGNAAKSGMLNQVRSLSGYVTHPATGKRLAFSILANNVTGDADSAVLKLHEDVVKLADQWLVEQATMTTRVPEPR